MLLPYPGRSELLDRAFSLLSRQPARQLMHIEREKFPREIETRFVRHGRRKFNWRGASRRLKSTARRAYVRDHERRSTMNRTSKCMLAAAVLAAVAADGLAQDQMQSPSIQANHGQSSAQQSRDADRCMVMARKRSGVDPTVLAANSTPLEQGKGLTITPIEQPTMAMGSSGGGTTGAGTGEMGGQSSQMGSSGAGATGSSGQMGSSEAGAMGASGTSGTTGATGSSATGGQPGGAGSAGMSSSAGTSGAAGSTGSSGAAGTTGAGHAAGAGGGQHLAMATADDYNHAFSTCMSSRGYTVGGGSSSGSSGGGSSGSGGGSQGGN
jgi:hypothetical protein